MLSGVVQQSPLKSSLREMLADEGRALEERFAFSLFNPFGAYNRAVQVDIFDPPWPSSS